MGEFDLIQNYFQREGKTADGVVLGIGDEAILLPSEFKLSGPDMRGVRQAVTRARRSGLTVRMRRHSEIGADEMALVLDMAKEAGYKVTTFHHAVESYKIADLLRANDVCSAVWADWWGFKMEAYDAIPENAGILYKTGACVVIHSDDENGIQRLNQEAAKAQGDARRLGIDIPDAEVIRWLTSNPAKAMGSRRRPAAWRPARWATWCCGTAIRCRSIPGPRRSGSMAPCCSTRTIASAAR